MSFQDISSRTRGCVHQEVARLVGVLHRPRHLRPGPPQERGRKAAVATAYPLPPPFLAFGGITVIPYIVVFCSFSRNSLTYLIVYIVYIEMYCINVILITFIEPVNDVIHICILNKVILFYFRLSLWHWFPLYIFRCKKKMLVDWLQRLIGLRSTLEIW